MTPFEIRTFVFPDDYPAARTLWESAGAGVRVGRSDTLEEIGKKCQRDPDLFLVAEMDGRMVGTVIGGFDGRRGLVYHLAVDETYRGHGIGSALMDELEKRLKEKGCLKCYLLVTPENTGAMQFYEKRGWECMKPITYGKEIQ